MSNQLHRIRANRNYWTWVSESRKIQLEEEQCKYDDAERQRLYWIDRETDYLTEAKEVDR